MDLESTRLKGNIDRASLTKETWALVQQTLRLSISALALALGFEVLAQIDSPAPPLLVRLAQSISQQQLALMWKQRENRERAMEQQQRKLFLASLARSERRGFLTWLEALQHLMPNRRWVIHDPEYLLDLLDAEDESQASSDARP